MREMKEYKGGMKMAAAWLLGLGVLTGHAAETRVAGFEDVTLGTPPLEAYAGPGGGGYYNGWDGAGGFASGGVFFPNSYNADEMSWSGWAYSTTVDTETADFGNQYSALTGGAAEGSVYAVAYAPSRLVLPAGWKAPLSIAVTNTTYAGIAMRDGDAFGRKFGDDPATPDVVEADYPDYFKLTISGHGAEGMELGTVEVYLADFRDAQAAYILDEWLEVDLAPLAGEAGSAVAEIRFALESTDVGAWGMNTPSYLAVDQLVLAATPTWGGYDLGADGWVDTGEFLGLVYPVGDFLYIQRLGRWAYLPEGLTDGEGAWLHLGR
jgi:hypothetical protein